MQNYDHRQLQLIINKIELFRKADISISQFSNDLEALLNVIDENDPDWKQNILHWWGEIEEINAVLAYRNVVQPDEQTKKIIDSTLKEIEHLVIKKQISIK